MSTNKELLEELIFQQRKLLESNLLFNSLYKELCSIPGYGPRIFQLIENEESVHATLRNLEMKTVPLKNDKGVLLENIPVMDLLSNLTIMQNAATGFSIAEYKLLIKYLVLSYWCSQYGLILDNKDDVFTDNSLNKEQQFIVDAIFEYPIFATIIIMEMQIPANTKGE